MDDKSELLADQAAILAEMEAFARERGIELSTLGHKAIRNHNAVKSLREGRMSFRIANRMRRYIARERERLKPSGE